MNGMYRAHQPNSHSKLGWQKFTDHVIKTLSAKANGVVFILWGGFAHKKEKLIDTAKHAVVKTAHPSPLSFNKFSGCQCFSMANAALRKLKREPVDWSLWTDTDLEGTHFQAGTFQIGSNVSALCFDVIFNRVVKHFDSHGDINHFV